jgi:hypothetical protein
VRLPTAATGHRHRGARPHPTGAALLVPVLAGALVAIGIGIFGRLHQPASYQVHVALFSGIPYLKAWASTLCCGCGLVQLGSGLAVHRDPDADPGRLVTLHRWSGRLAVLASVPVAADCLYSLGFQSGNPRVLLHSLFGCLFYGAFTVKMLVIGRPGAPRSTLPLIGGVVFAGLIGLWLTSAFWLFGTDGWHL